LNALLVMIGGAAALVVLGCSWLLYRQGQRAAVREQQLRQAQTLFEQAFNNNVDPMCISRFDGTLVEVNQVFCELSGFKEEELLGQRTVDLGLWHRLADRKAMIELLHRHGRIKNLEVDVCRKNGEILPALLSVSRISYADTSCLLSNIRDLSDIKALEAQQRHWERQSLSTHNLEAMGTLVGGIARQFNNMLAAIIGYSELALDDVDADSQTAIDLERIQAKAQAARHLVEQLLAFGQGRQYSKQSVDLLLLLPALRQQLQILAGDRFRVESRVTGKSALILADGASLQLALLNICRNALEAMPQGGVVVLGIRSPAGTGPSFAGVETGLPAGEFVHFYVKDSGRGIASGDLERIFHPFYSTKPSGQGTGMGLSVAHGIIRDHGGLIRVNSRKGSGTTIHLFLPLLSGDPHAAAV
jgi:PAS domain S-box-containing protein